MDDGEGRCGNGADSVFQLAATWWRDGGLVWPMGGRD